jgi:hypothetical protein
LHFLIRNASHPFQLQNLPPILGPVLLASLVHQLLIYAARWITRGIGQPDLLQIVAHVLAVALQMEVELQHARCALKERLA